MCRILRFEKCVSIENTHFLKIFFSCVVLRLAYHISLASHTTWYKNMSDIDYAALNARLLGNVENLLNEWYPEGRKLGVEYKVAGLSGGKGMSLSINCKTGVWADFATGDKGGDLISLYAAMQGISQSKAAKELEPSCVNSPVVDLSALLQPKPSKLMAIPAAILASATFSCYPVGIPSGKWIYPDESGNPILVIARYDTDKGKEFRPWHWDGSQLVSKHPDVRPLYNMAALHQHPDRYVLITEGEKAADAAQKIVGDMAVVTTWPGGSNAHTKADWSILKGRHLILWPDADKKFAKDEKQAQKYGVEIGELLPKECQPGIKAMNEVAEIVDYASCVIFDAWFDMSKPDGWDAADALDEGWTIEEFKKLYENSVKQSDDGKLGIFTEYDYDLSALKPTEFVIDGFLSTGITVIAGAPGVGKTSTLLPLAAIAAHLCDADNDLKPHIRRVVVYVTEDVGQAERVLYGLKKHLNSNISEEEFKQWFHIVPARRSDAKYIAELITASREKYTVVHQFGTTEFNAYPLVVLDTANATIDLDNENDNAEVGKAVATIKESLNGVPAWIIAHTPKALKRVDVHDMSARGAGAFEGDASGTCFVFHDEDLDQRVIAHGKCRFEAKFPEVHFESTTHSETVQTPWGQDQEVVYRFGIPRAGSKEVREEAKKQVDEVEHGLVELNQRTAFINMINAVNRNGGFIGKNDAIKSVSGKNEIKRKVFEDMLADGTLENYEVPPHLVTHHSQKIAVRVSSRFKNNS